MFCDIMQECTVHEAELERQIVNLNEEELASSFKMKQSRMVEGRPRLRSKLAVIKQESVSAVIKKNDSESWGHAIGYPSVFSLHMKRRLYFTSVKLHVSIGKYWVSLHALVCMVVCIVELIGMC